MTFGEQNTVPQSFQLLDKAFDSGINFFDSAEMYGIFFALSVHFFFFFLPCLFFSFTLNFGYSMVRYPVPQRAETQGRSEEYFGRWMRSRKISRERVIFATKVLLVYLIIYAYIITPVRAHYTIIKVYIVLFDLSR